MELDSVAKELDEIENSIDSGDKSDNLLKKRDELRLYHKKLSKQYQEITGKSVEQASKLSTKLSTRTIRLETPTKPFTLGIVLLTLSNLVFLSALYNLEIPGLLGYGPSDLINGAVYGLVETVDETVIAKMQYALFIITVTSLASILLFIITSTVGFAKKNYAVALDGMALFISSTVLFYGFIGQSYLGLNRWDAIWPMKEGVIMLAAAYLLTGILLMIVGFLMTTSGGIYRFLSIIEAIVFIVAGAYSYVQVSNNISFTSHYVFSTAMLMLAAGIGLLRSLFVKIKE